MVNGNIIRVFVAIWDITWEQELFWIIVYRNNIAPPYLFTHCYIRMWNLVLWHQRKSSLTVIGHRVLRRKRVDVLSHWWEVEKLHKLSHLPNIKWEVKSRRVTRAWHQSSMGQTTNAYEVLVGKMQSEESGRYFGVQRYKPENKWHTRPPLPLYHSQTRPHQKHNQAWRVASKLTGTDVKRIHCSDWHAVFPFPDGRILPELIKCQERD